MKDSDLPLCIGLSTRQSLFKLILTPLKVGFNPLKVGFTPLNNDQLPLATNISKSEIDMPLATNISQFDIDIPFATKLSPLNTSQPQKGEDSLFKGFPPSSDALPSSDAPPSPSSDELAYPDGIYQYILKMCAIHPINIFAGFYYGNPLGGTMGVLLLMTSVNYWRKPLLKSVRRYIDISVAFITVPYHIGLSLFTTNKLLCAGPTILGALAYPFSIWLERKKYTKTAAFLHCALHGLVCAGATLTYRDYYIHSQ
uniref:Uncharacterized protein n=1 Tax=viral metagenome TaxID=1070528 RepID=A0A6C0B5Z1_9ZZZZ